MFGRTIKCCPAKDNGRASEFIRRKDYPDKSLCYECGELGHLSYGCPKNMLGEREPPPKKPKKKKGEGDSKSSYGGVDEELGEEEEEEEGEDPYDFSLSGVIDECVRMAEKQDGAGTSQVSGSRKRKIVKDSYFSDDEEEQEA